MEKSGFAQTLHQAEEVRLLLPVLLDRLDKAIPAELSTALFRFHEISQANHFLESAGAMASSLGSLICRCTNRELDAEDRAQVISIIQSLQEEIDSQKKLERADTRSPLVTPVSPSQRRDNNRVILYIDNSALQLILHKTLTNAGFSTVHINALDELESIGEAEAPAAIISDLKLFELNPRSSEILARFRKRFSPSPHLLCLGDDLDIPARLQAVRLGATRFLSKPPDIGRLTAILKGVTARTQTDPFRAILIEDEQILGSLYEIVLKDAGIETLTVTDPIQAPALIRDFNPDVVVSDIYMPGCNGLELLALLRQDEMLADTAIILLSSENDTGRLIEAMDLGADDYLTKPVDNQLFVATVIARAKRIRALRRSRSEYRHLLERKRELEQAAFEASPAGSDKDFHYEEIISEDVSADDYVVVRHDLDADDSR